MTPEQEALADSLARCRKLVAAVREDLVVFAQILPVDEDFDAEEPGGEVRRLLKAFVKSFEQLQDHLSRKLFRAVVMVQAMHQLHGLGGAALSRAIVDNAATLVGFDARRWLEFTTVRNNLAHEYTMNFDQVAPVLNRAWQFMPEMIEVADLVDRHIAANDLLRPAA